MTGNKNVTYCERNSKYLSALNFRNGCVGERDPKLSAFSSVMLESQSYGWSIRNLIVTQNGDCVWERGLDIADRSSTMKECQAETLGINAA